MAVLPVPAELVPAGQAVRAGPARDDHLQRHPVAGLDAPALRGALFGDSNPLYDIPMLLGLYRSGDLKLDELITRRYRLDEISQAYQDLEDGKNIRGVIVHEAS